MLFQLGCLSFFPWFGDPHHHQHSLEAVPREAMMPYVASCYMAALDGKRLRNGAVWMVGFENMEKWWNDHVFEIWSQITYPQRNFHTQLTSEDLFLRIVLFWGGLFECNMNTFRGIRHYIFQNMLKNYNPFSPFTSTRTVKSGVLLVRANVCCTSTQKGRVWFSVIWGVSLHRRCNRQWLS